jgi:hypothetical protein
MGSPASSSFARWYAVVLRDPPGSSGICRISPSSNSRRGQARIVRDHPPHCSEASQRLLERSQSYKAASRGRACGQEFLLYRQSVRVGMHRREEAVIWASASRPRAGLVSGDGRLRLGLVTTRQCEVIVTEHRKFQTHQQSFPPNHHPVHPDAMTPEHDDLRDSIASMLPASAQSSASTSSSSNASLDDELTPFPSPMLSAKSLAGLSRMFSLGAWSTVR